VFVKLALTLSDRLDSYLIPPQKPPAATSKTSRTNPDKINAFFILSPDLTSNDEVRANKAIRHHHSSEP
jgi:hypothetical protein